MSVSANSRKEASGGKFWNSQRASRARHLAVTGPEVPRGVCTPAMLFHTPGDSNFCGLSPHTAGT